MKLLFESSIFIEKEYLQTIKWQNRIESWQFHNIIKEKQEEKSEAGLAYLLNGDGGF